jgi:DNA-binding transcriptional MerR regulator
MYKISSVLISFFIISCSVESAKCTKEDILQLSGAGYSKNEINKICDSNETKNENIHIESVSATEDNVTSSSTETLADKLLNSGAESDLEGKAHKLYVKASNQIQSMKKSAGSYGEALKLHQSALSKIESITSDYDFSNIAVALISDQMKIAGLTLSELEQLESPLQTLANAEKNPLQCTLSVARDIKKSLLRLSIAGFSKKDIFEICNNASSVISNPTSKSVSVVSSPKTYDMNNDFKRIYQE